MPESVTFSDKAFLSGLNAACTDFQRDSASMVQVLGEQIAEAARALAPTSHDPRAEPGKLKASISSDPGIEPRGPFTDVGVHDPDAYYGLFVEYGTYKMAAEPFMRPALAQAGAQLRSLGVGAGMRSPRARALVKRANLRNKVREAYQSGKISEKEARSLSAQISSQLRYRSR